MAQTHFSRSRQILILAIVLLVGVGVVVVNAKTATKTPVITEGTVDPRVWGTVYPAQYQSWKATAEPTPVGKSRYKRGFDTNGVIYNKIDEYPYLGLLLQGWGYGVEFTEPRGHVYMIEDQLEVEPARLKAGGSCLSCKTPYAQDLYGEMGADYFSKSYAEVRAKIPAQDQLLGVSCVDCHQSNDMSLKISRGFTLGKALGQIGKDQASLSTHEKRSLVCAQCHVTYSMPKNAEMKSTDVVFPWAGGKWGKVSVENIIANIEADPAYGEWTQSVTGFKLGFVRHPEFEFFSKESPHWEAGLSCADCHMPSTDSNGETISDHRIMSPLKNNLQACSACHEEDTESLRKMVFEIQDETASLLIQNGYAVARVAKLFELAHLSAAAAQIKTSGSYVQAKDAYEEAFYRVMFIQNENSTGFHNPPEASRILNDAKQYIASADKNLRQALAAAQIQVPEKIDLELEKYLNNRGEKNLQFSAEMEIKDPKAKL